MKRVALVGGLVYGVVLTLLLAIGQALASGKVVGRGRFVGGVDHDVVELRILGRFDAYADEHVVNLGSDLVTSFALMTLAGMAGLSFAVAMRMHPGNVGLGLFFLTTALGATFLAFDEQYEFIDSLGYNVEALYVPDIVFYAPPALVFAYVFRRYLTASLNGFLVLVAGAALFVGAQLLDRLPHDRFEGLEEKAEIASTVVLAVGYSITATRLLSVSGTKPTPSQ